MPLPSFPTDNIHLQHDQMGDVRPTPPRSKPPNEISDSEADEFSFEGGDVDISNDPFVRSHSILQVSVLFIFFVYFKKYSQCLINSRKQIARLACGASHRLFEKRTHSISRFLSLCVKPCLVFRVNFGHFYFYVFENSSIHYKWFDVYLGDIQ